MVGEAGDGGALGLLLHGLHERGGHDLPDPVDGVEIVPGGALPYLGLVHGGGEGFPRAVVAGEEARARLAHMADAEGEDDAVERDGPAVVDRLEEVLGGFVAPALAVLQLGEVAVAVAVAKREDVGGFPDPAVPVELFDLLGAETFDVEGGAGDEMLQPFNGLRGADEAAGAAADGVAFFPHRVGAAFGAGGGEDVGLCPIGALGEVDIGDLRDHVTGAVDLDPVADADVLAAPDLVPLGVAAGDVVLVVERGVGDDDATHRDGGEPGDGGEGAGAADLDVDGFEPGPGKLCRELVGDGPAGSGGPEAETGLEGEVVDLVDHAVDVVAEGGALGLDRAVVGEHVIRARAEACERVGLEAKVVEPVDGAHLGVGKGGGECAPGIGEELQRAGGGYGGVELAEGAGGGVPGIGEGLGACVGLAGVQRFEIGVAHVDLAPDFQGFGGTGQGVGDVRDREGVGV